MASSVSEANPEAQTFFHAYKLVAGSEYRDEQTQGAQRQRQPQQQ